MGNLHSVAKALEKEGSEVRVSSDPADLEGASGVVLPGVGAFPRAVERLRDLGLDGALTAYAESGRPLLGICLGLQLLFEESSEHGGAEGLGLLSGRVDLLDRPGRKVPHMGWAEIEWVNPSPLDEGTSDGTAFYFAHSFVVDPVPEELLAVASYGGPFPCAAGRDNVFGVQFHPEKSSSAGLRIIRNFVQLASGKDGL